MKQYNEHISYEIADNGYAIYLDGQLWITQYAPFDKVFLPEGTHEENCLAQIDTIVNPPEVNPMDNPAYAEGYEQAILDMLEMEGDE